MKLKRLSKTIQQESYRFRVAIRATWNAIKEYWNISHDNREKMQALEQYLECHKKLCSMLGYEPTLQSFFDDRMNNNSNDYSYSHDENGRHYEEGELVPAKGSYGPHVYHSPEYIRRSNEVSLVVFSHFVVDRSKDVGLVGNYYRCF